MLGRANVPLKSELCGLACEIFFDHQSHLEGDGVIKLSKVKSCELSDFFKSVYEGVSMYEKLS